jgi:LPXTG-site transpeptidase (sortase) family protein
MMSFYTIRPTKWHELKHKTRTTLLPNTLITIAACLFIIGLSVSLYDWHSGGIANHRAAQLVYEANHGISQAVPSTTKPIPSAFASYTVASNLPRYIFIPKLSVQAIIKPLGLTATGQVATPNNVYDTGWYTKSNTPGQPGAAVIDGHVSSWTTNGVFYGLKSLQTGDAIQVELGDGAKINYTVIKKQVYGYQQVNMSALLSPIDAGKPGLNLITCTGDVIKGTNDFTERVVIFATEI